MNSLEQKLEIATIGGFVADAASMPVHWIYDLQKLDAVLGESSKTPEFFSTLSCPFYNSNDFPGHYSLGSSSPYGEQSFGVLEILSKLQFQDLKQFSTQFAEAFYQFLTTYTGRNDHAAKIFIENYKSGKLYPDCGADDGQAMAFGKLVHVLTLFGGDDDLYEKAEVVIRAHQNNTVAVSHAKFLLELLYEVTFNNKSLKESYTTVSKGIRGQSIQSSLDVVNEFVDKTELSINSILVDKYGKHGHSCANPNAFVGIMLALLRSNSFEEAVRLNIMIGGDNCGRASILGSIAAVVFGLNASFVEKTTNLEAVKLKVKELHSKRASKHSL